MSATLEAVKVAIKIANMTGFTEARIKTLEEEREYLRTRVAFLETELAKATKEGTGAPTKEAK